MARYYPCTREEMSKIFGVGERKLEEFGEVFSNLIASHLQTHPRTHFSDN